MRHRLLQSVLVVCSGKEVSGPAVIDDVIRHAQVARGTFYKYFDSLDKAIGELGAILADEMTVGIYPVYDVLENPLQRVSTGFLLFLSRAAIDPAWGAFIANIGLINSESILVSAMTKDVTLGIKSGDFKVTIVEAAADLILGVQTEAIRRLIRGVQGESYILKMTGMLLRSLAVPSAKADKAVEQAYKQLCLDAPKHISWWQPLDRA